MIKNYYALLFLLTLCLIVACAKETPIGEEVVVKCSVNEVEFSEFCVDTTIQYYIGYPEKPCIDSMLIHFPNHLQSYSSYGTDGYREDFAFLIYIENWNVYQMLPFDCVRENSFLKYVVLIDENEFDDLSEINTWFYYLNQSGNTVIDSSEVKFVPWH
ncbi:MAG: hypothetical protein HKM23_09675 [Nitrosopumilus sp.]|nr:hypothetical protein [Bacteroidia bacterium]NND87565.1 hypothetical protein [Nitrosopumilus sp.]